MSAGNKTCVMSAVVLGLGIMIAGSAMDANGQCCKINDQGKCKCAGQTENGQKKCKVDGKDVCGQDRHKGAGQEKCGRGKHKGNGKEKRGMVKDNCPWAAERNEFRKAQHEKIKAFMKKRQEAMKSARETAKNEKDPQKIIAMIKANRAKADAESKVFFGGIEKENDEFLTSVFSKYKVSKDEQAKIKEHAAAKRNKMKKMHEERSKKMIEALNKLEKKDDLTKEEIMNTMRKMHRRPKHGHGEKWQKKGHKRGGRRDDHKGGRRGHGAGGQGDSDD